jgi:arylsulfatase A-like enzyme
MERSQQHKRALAATRPIVLRPSQSRRIYRYLLATVLWLAALWLMVSPAQAQMNMLVIMTDDQRFDTVGKMPNIAAMASRGVRFTNAYASTPLCAPSRASFYSGGYLSQNTGVQENSRPNGGAWVFNDKVNLGTVLQSAGYRTFFVGKWVNGYEGLRTYVPPGWDRFVGRHSYATTTDWSGFIYTIGSSDALSSTGQYVKAQQYTTYYERDRVLDFLGSSAANQPFFILWSPTAPHGPATPAAEDAYKFSDYIYRGRGYGETDLSDKPAWVRNDASPGSDEFVRKQLRSLQSLDRSFAAIVDKLRATGRLDNTLIAFMSDNGFIWGEHRLWGKKGAFEETAKLPFFIVMPGVTPRVETALVSPTLDLGPTLYALAGVPRKTDGRSLVSLLHNPGQGVRSEFFLESSATYASGSAIWAGLRRDRWKYIKYWTGEEELYDLYNDPYELRSRHKDANLATLKASLSARTDALLGLAVIPVTRFPVATVGTSYRFQFKIWGGVAPFTWKLNSGQLPPGLTLGAASGVLAGVPTTPGTYQFSVRLTDSSLATQARKARTFATRTMKLVVGS